MNIAENTLLLKQDFDEVHKAGKRAIMAAAQNYGKKKGYACAFKGWATEGIYPAYDIVMTGDATQAFYALKGANMDFAARLEECGVVLDTSKVTNFAYTFGNMHTTRLPEIDTRGAGSLVYTFMEGDDLPLTTIDNLILKDDGSQTFSNPFAWAANLVNLKITGAIGQNGFDMQYATKLSRASIESIMSHLAQGQFTITLSKAAVNKAFETSSGAKDGSTSEAWAQILADHRDVTVSLV